MSAIKFKVGDKVRVVEMICGHSFEIGQECVVSEIVTHKGKPVHYLVCSKSRDDRWYMTDEELEPCETK